jgi:SAM-dependent methyltransferase
MTEYYDPAHYDATVQGVAGDVEFYLSLAREAQAAGRPVLELACGTGRISVPIAQAGVQVIGLDRSPAMLGRAREKAAGLPNARWVEGDMRDFELPERFGLIMIPFRSFQHLLAVEDQLACLACVRRHLNPEGRFAFTVFNPDIIRIANALTTNRSNAQLVVHKPERAHWEKVSYDPAVQKLDCSFIDERLDEAGVVTSRVYRGLTLRYFYRFEVEHLLARAGFSIEALYGDHFRAQFTGTSPEMVFLARPCDP